MYHAKRAVSVEQLCEENPGYHPDTGSDSDEFFLATDFDNPLPRSKYTQSVDYLDIVAREEVLHMEDTSRR